VRSEEDIKMNAIDIATKNKMLRAQKNEITEHFIYQRLSDSVKDPHNKEVLSRISKDELKHYNFWKSYTQAEVKPSRLKIVSYYLLSKIFGLTFGIKLMETGEGHARLTYQQITKIVPEAEQILRDEAAHEKELIELLDEERLKYVGSMVLGLSDALVELTGALAGFTLALQNTRLIALTGIITGIAASLSMSASEYLSTKTEENGKSPIKASMYTGLAYVLTVLLLIFPFLVFDNYFLCMGISLVNAILVVFVFTFYLSVAQDLSFTKRFLEMVVICLGVASISFAIGFVVRHLFNIDIG
jgi:VIT1/CCC1 family predicted Fe2+/Mn2+ transporter